MRHSLSVLTCVALSASAAGAQPLKGRPATVEFQGVSGPQAAPSGAAQELAYRVDGSDRMTVHVRVDGQGPFNFLIDTGADRTVISKQVAGQLKLGTGISAVMHSVTGQSRVRTTAIDRLGFSTKTVRNVRAAVLDDRNIGADGILGIDSLRSERVTFDFRKGVMTIVPSAIQAERVGKDEVVVRGKLRSGRLVLTQASAGRRSINVVIDTGADVSIGNQALYRALRGTRLLRPMGKVIMRSVTGEVLAGDMMALKQLEVGGIVVQDLNIVFADAHTFKSLRLDHKPALLMGMNTLKAFERVSIDFANRKFRVVVPGESSLRTVTFASR